MAELNGKRIYDILETIDSKVDTLLMWRGEHIESHKLLERDVSDNRAILFENPGLIQKVNTLLNCKTHITQWQKFWIEILKYIIIASIVSIISWLMIFYKAN